jgi:hypothetical protein
MNQKRIRTAFHIWQLVNFFESLTVLVYLLSIPSDPKTSWLLGYSKTRWVILSGISFLTIAALTAIYLTSSKVKKDYFAKILSKLKNNKNLPIHLELLSILFILLTAAGGYYLFRSHSNQMLYQDALTIRLAPIVLLASVISLQTFVITGYLHAWSSSSQVNIRNLIASLTFPNIREGLFNILEKTISKIADKSNENVFTLLLVLLPFLFTTILLQVNYQATIWEFVPGRSDEMFYWRETNTFAEYGFEGGQYSHDELVAPAKFSPFGSHGPSFPVLFGLIGRLFGWEFYTQVIINLIMVPLAIIAFVLVNDLDKKQLLVTLLLLASFWPVWFFIPTNMQEAFHLSIAIVTASLFYKHLTDREVDLKIAISLFLILLLATTVRFNWSFLFAPYFLSLIPKLNRKKTWALALAPVVMIGFGVFLFRYLNSPWPWFSYRFLQTLEESWTQAFANLYSHILLNTKNLIYLPDTMFFIRMLRYQIVGLFAILIIDFFKLWKNQKDQAKDLLRNDRLLHILNLGLILILVVTLYDVADTRDYRTFAPHLLLSILILILFSRYRLVYMIIITNLIVFSSFNVRFSQFHWNNFKPDRATMKAFEESISDIVLYQPNGNRWCNTLAFSREDNLNIPKTPLIMVDPGIGITYIRDWELFYSIDLKSKYVLLDPENFNQNHPDLFEKLNLQQLTETPLGTLYLNPQSDCD